MAAGVDFEAAEREIPQLRAFYDDKRLFYRNVFWLVFGGAAATLGVNLANTVMPLHMAKIGLDAEEISSVMAIRGYLTLPLALFLAQLSDRWQGKAGRRLPFLAASIPFTVAGMVLFPCTSSALSCVLIFAVFYFAMNVKYDAYPFIAYDIARKPHWGRVNGLSLVMGGIAAWLGQIWLMPMMDEKGDLHVYVLAAFILAVASIATVLFSKEPPLCTETPPDFNPVKVIGHVIRVGFSDKRIVQLFVASALVCGFAVSAMYIPLQAQVNMGMSTGDIGTQILQYGAIINTCMVFFTGWAIDKIGSTKAILVGFALGLLATLIAFGPSSGLTTSIFSAAAAVSSAVLGLSFTPTPALALAVANVLIVVTTTLTYWGQHVFTASWVRSEDLATFGTCNGAVNVLVNTNAVQLSGVLIKRVFGGNYGVGFAVGAVICAIGVPFYFWVARTRSRELAQGAAPAGAV
jgi:MFS family permease